MIATPTIATIKAQIIADIESKIGQTIPAMPKAFFRVFATAVAGVLSLLYRYAAWCYNQILPQTASADSLTALGEQYGIIRVAAVAAELEITVLGEEGKIVPAGTLWLYGSTVYEQDEAVEISSGEATAEVKALVAGSAGNRLDGDVLTLSSPIAGIIQDATVYATTLSGEDAETDEELRSRIIDRLARRPQGGAAADYVLWACEVPGIVKAFAFRTAPGDVTVYPMIALTGSRIPDAGKLAEVLAYLEDTARRPLCANVYTAALTERVVNITVTALQPATVATRAAIEAAWKAFLYNRFPAQYSDEAGRSNWLSKADLYGEAVGAGARSITFEVFLDAEVTETEYYNLPNDELLKLGTVTWPV